MFNLVDNRTPKSLASSKSNDSQTETFKQDSEIKAVQFLDRNSSKTILPEIRKKNLSFLMGDNKGRLHVVEISDEMTERLEKNRPGSPFRPRKSRRKLGARTSPRRGARLERGWTSHGDRDSSTARTDFSKLITVISETEDNSYSHHGRVNCIAYSDEYLATGGQDKSIVLFQGGKYVDTLFGHKDEITGLSFSRDLTMLASCSKDWTLWIWNLKERPVQCVNTFGHTRVTSYVTGAFHCVSFSPDDMYVVFERFFVSMIFFFRVSIMSLLT